MNANCIHRYWINDDGSLPLGHHGKEVYRDGEMAYTICDCGSDASSHDPVVKALASAYLKCEDQETADGEYEFCPNIPDMVHDQIVRFIQDGFDYDSLPDRVRIEVDAVMKWHENVAFEGGGGIFIRVPKFLVEGASRLD